VEGRLHQDIWEARGLSDHLDRSVARSGTLSAYGLADEILREYRAGRSMEDEA
jgi:hypothetical protein